MWVFSSAFWFTLNNVWYFFPVFSILFYIISGFLYFFFKIGQNKDIILVFVLQFLTIVVLIFWVSAIMYWKISRVAKWAKTWACVQTTFGHPLPKSFKGGNVWGIVLAHMCPAIMHVRIGRSYYTGRSVVKVFKLRDVFLQMEDQ